MPMFTLSPPPWGQGALKTGSQGHYNQTVHIWVNFMKQNLWNTPDLAGQIRSDLRVTMG